jgi:PKD repeat protein
MGVTYRYRTTLDLGPHQVHYVFSDGKHEVRYPAVGEIDGPSVTNLAPLAVIKTPVLDVRYIPDDYIPFSAIGSEDPEDDDLDFSWSSDIDGLFATTQVADKRLSEGIHIVTLTVTDEHGGEHTASVTVLVKPFLADPYLVDYKRTPDVPVEKDMIRYSVYLNNRGEKTASGLLVSFLVDNTYVGSEVVTVPIETIREVKFTWEAVAGEHTVAFEIPGDDLTFIEYVNINSVPIVQLSVVNVGDDRGRYEIGEEIYFQATVNDDDGDHITYLWEFGDTATSTQSAPSHMYAKAGTYLVTLTVKDARGGEKVDTFDVVIKQEETSSSGGLGAGLIAGIVVVVLVIIVVIAIMMMRGRDGEVEEAAPAPEEPKPDVPDYLMPDATPSTPPAVPEEPEFPDYSNGIPEEQPTGETSDDDYLGY